MVNYITCSYEDFIIFLDKEGDGIKKEKKGFKFIFGE